MLPGAPPFFSRPSLSHCSPSPAGAIQSTSIRRPGVQDPTGASALKALAEERERRHRAELAALEAQMQAKLEALTRANEALSRDLDRANALVGGSGRQAWE